MNRPGGVLVIAIIGLVFGLCGFICNPINALSQIMPASAEPPPSFGDPMIDGLFRAMSDAVASAPGWYKALKALNSVILWLLSILLLSSSIGALMMKPWARKTFIVWAVLYSVLRLIESILDTVVMGPATSQALAEVVPIFQGSGSMFGMILGALCGVSCFLIYPIAVLVYMTRPGVKASFESGGAPTGYTYGGQYGQQTQQPPYGGYPSQYGGYPPQGYQQPQYPPAPYVPPGYEQEEFEDDDEEYEDDEEEEKRPRN